MHIFECLKVSILLIQIIQCTKSRWLDWLSVFLIGEICRDLLSDVFFDIHEKIRQIYLFGGNKKRLQLTTMLRSFFFVFRIVDNRRIVLILFVRGPPLLHVLDKSIYMEGKE